MATSWLIDGVGGIIMLLSQFGMIPATRYILDQVSDSIGAYGLRKLKISATKSIRVRRSSDNTELDIGFIGGSLDTASLLSFVGSVDGFVTTKYDQNGNNNGIQSTAGNQTRIVSSGVLDIGAYYNGNNGYNFTTPFNLTDITVYAIINVANLVTTRTIIGSMVTSAFQFRVSKDTGKVGNLQTLKSGIASIGYSTNAITQNEFVSVATTYSQTSGDYKFYISGALNGSGTNQKTMTTNTSVLGMIPNELFLGYMTDVFIFNRILTLTEIQMLYANSKSNNASIL